MWRRLLSSGWLVLPAMSSGAAEVMASTNPYRAVSEHWGDDAAAPLQWMLVALGVLLILLAVLLVVRWWRQRHQHSHPWLVFHRIAGVAELSLRDRLLLMRVARQQGLPTPLTLLLSGRTLRVHGRGFVKAQAPWRRAALMQRIASIRRHVFGRMGGEPETPTGMPNESEPPREAA